jgi:hypothetical protein
MSYEELIAYLNRETGKLSWQELQPYFAKGSLLHLETGYDLVDIAASLVKDDKSIILPLIENKLLGQLQDETAKTFDLTNMFWAVVVAPWVVIQKTGSDSKTEGSMID